MIWELYEVWSIDTDGHEELIETTKSLKEARLLAHANLSEYYTECVIYQENEEGEPVEIERIS